ncbi:MAG: aldehyde ferredoxin oxidoreductase family protein [Deltaproteobacteria bacterium]|nr:aldehyde ferredoxin oxidoreductase family protein [Deltaproteobacteria bacterium]
MNGWVGKVLRIDLSEKKHEIEDLDEDIARNYLGGRGLASKYLYDEIDPEVDAFDPDNKLIVAAGCLTGTGAIAACRTVFVTKSPLGTIGCANVGASFGCDLKYAGYDMMILEGKADGPIYLMIEDDKIEFLSADELWGKDCYQTDDILREKIKDSWKAKEYSIACIGPAGEKRCGVGSVMGSKNIKAIMIKGTNGIRVADPEGFINATTEVLEVVKQSHGSMESFPKFGSAGILHIYNEVGMLATRNYQTGVFEHAADIGGEAMAEKHLRKIRACFSCPQSCGGIMKATDEKFMVTSERPEFETVWVFGADCGNNNTSAILKAHDLCNQYGMDIISVGNTVAMCMEMFERGYLTEKDIGFPLKFGDAEAMVKLVELTGKREGFGDEVANAGFQLAQKFNHPELFVGVKKLEAPAYDPRVCQAQGLNQATAARGACHNKGYTMGAEIFGLPSLGGKVDPYATEGKAQLTKKQKERHSLPKISRMPPVCLITPEPASFSSWACGHLNSTNN